MAVRTPTDMSPKKLELQSKYEKFDLNNDGIISDEELDRAKEMVYLELREEKSEAQKMMAWLAIIIMVVTTVVFIYAPHI